MISKKIRKLIIGIMLIATVFVGGCQGLKIATKPQDFKPISEMTKVKSIKNSISQEVVMSELIKEQKIIVGSCSVSEKTTIKGTFENNLFKNNISVNMIGSANMVLDFSNLSNNQIKVNDVEKTVTIYSALPNIEITLLEDKNTYSEEKGIFTFGDKKITAEQYDSIKSQVKDNMLNKIKNDEDYIKFAKEKSVESVNILLGILNNDNYEINIVWVG